MARPKSSLIRSATASDEQPQVFSTEERMLMDQNFASEFPADPDHNGLLNRLDSIRSDVGALAELTRSEIQDAFEKLTEKQLAASESQSCVLRTLTEAIFTSAASSGSNGELESLLLQFEDRIISTIRETVENITSNSAERSPSDSATAAAATKKPASGNRTWDEIRNSFLSDSTELQDTQNSRETTATANSGLSTAARVIPNSPAAVPEPEPPLEIPEPANIDELTEAELRSTLIQRDQLISTLISRMRRQSYSLTDQITTEQLRLLASEMPDELSRRVQHTLTRIDEQLRLGELEMSLERARIAREITQLKHSRQQVEQAAHQLGWAVKPDGTLDRTTAFTTKGSSSRRWLGKLGLSE